MRPKMAAPQAAARHMSPRDRIEPRIGETV
jgi:hypothetical protein